MQLGKWTTQGGAANMSNLLYFKLGGVVGFTNIVAPNGTAWPGADAVKFNPVTGSPVYTAYTSIPYWNGTDFSDGYISTNAYHKTDNVLAGRGDPCKLIGLTVEQIRAGTIDNLKWRLPKEAENVVYTASVVYVTGDGWVKGTTPTAGIHSGVIGTSFLPAAGEWLGSVTSNIGWGGYWWTSRASSATLGYRLYFISGDTVSSSASGATSSIGYSVRCVPQS
jgi:hypothetical protein